MSKNSTLADCCHRDVTHAAAGLRDSEGASKLELEWLFGWRSSKEHFSGEGGRVGSNHTCWVLSCIFQPIPPTLWLFSDLHRLYSWHRFQQTHIGLPAAVHSKYFCLFSLLQALPLTSPTACSAVLVGAAVHYSMVWEIGLDWTVCYKKTLDWLIIIQFQPVRWWLQLHGSKLGIRTHLWSWPDFGWVP